MNEVILAEPKSASMLEELDSLSALDLEDFALNAEIELLKIRSANGEFVWASDSPNFKYAFFGRDTATVVENLANRPEYHEQCCKWLVSLARYQGDKTVTKSDERRGALPHEIRSIAMEGHEVDDRAKALFYELRPRWCENTETDTIVYYGELDGPSRFIRACMALARNGVDLSQQIYEHMSGEQRNLLDACSEAVVYIQDRVKESDIGLVELQPPENPETLTNQTLKDSRPAYLFNIDGKPVLPNRNAPRAPLEAQLLSYEALVEYAAMVTSDDHETAQNLRTQAVVLKTNTLERFMIEIPETGDPYLAAMIDRDPTTGLTRLLNTRMSDAAEGLCGTFFNGDEPLVAQLRRSIVREMVSDDFLTDGGVRCRALSDHGLFSFAEYHGSLPAWIVITHTTAKGMHRQGYSRIAHELWMRMISVMYVAGQFQEFCYFDERGRLLMPENDVLGQADWILSAEEHPQQNQAWSISAALEAVHILNNQDMEFYASADRDFEDAILATMPQYRHNPSQLIAKLRQNMQIYRLEQARQLAGAHEVDITAVSNGGQVLYPVEYSL